MISTTNSIASNMWCEMNSGRRCRISDMAMQTFGGADYASARRRAQNSGPKERGKIVASEGRSRAHGAQEPECTCGVHEDSEHRTRARCRAQQIFTAPSE